MKEAMATLEPTECGDSMAQSDHPSISSNGFYRPEHVEHMFGRRFRDALTRHGLRSVCGWYRGEHILEAYDRTVREKQVASGSPPALALAGGEAETGEAGNVEEKKIHLDQGTRRARIQPVPTRIESESLSSQREKLRDVGS